MIRTWIAPFIATILCVFLSFSVISKAQQEPKLALVGNKVATLIDTPSNPSRVTEVIAKAFAQGNVTLTATTQAWSGSGLRNGKFQGYVDHYSLNPENPNFIYSVAYATIPLHIASTYPRVVDMTRIEKLYRQRVGIENRFANTDELRGERDVRWARTPNFLSNIEALAGQRVDYILADKYMLEEFNKLLIDIDQEPLYLSARPIYEISLKLGINRNVENAASIIQQFNASIAELQTTQAFQAIFESSSNTRSSFDVSLYEDILRKW